MYVLIFLLNSLNCQSDWTAGSNLLGPVSDWGSKFWQSESVTISTPNQISPVASGTVNPYAWTKHVIDADANIEYNAIWPADFDNDGNVDLAGWKSITGQLVFYKNNGSDSFVPFDSFSVPTVGAQWAFLYGADLDNDGKTDVVVPGGYGMTGLYWYKNNGNFNFTQNTISNEVSYSIIDGADIDRSGHISLVATMLPGGAEIWKNSGGGNFACVETLIAAGVWRARFVDVNNDDYPDVVCGSTYPYYYQVFLNDGMGYFNTVANDTFASGASIDALWDADINNDGYKDLVVGVMNGYDEIWWMQNNGSGTGWTKHIVHTGDNYYADGGSAADLDFDGKADVASGFVGRVAWFQQVTLDSFNTYVIDSAGSYTHWVVPFSTGTGSCFRRGDVNLLVCWSSGSFVWYENNMVNGFSNGWLTSSILKGQCDSTSFSWQNFGWKTCCPFDSAISFQFRSGPDSASIIGKAFSKAVKVTQATQVSSISLAPYINLTDKFFQYQVDFKAGSDAGIVDSVWVTDTCSNAGINENNSLSEFLKVYPGKICYSIIQNTKITLSLYNVSGRLIKTLDSGDKNKGCHWITLPNLPNGSYLAVLNLNGRRLTKKLVIIK